MPDGGFRDLDYECKVRGPCAHGHANASARSMCDVLYDSCMTPCGCAEAGSGSRCRREGPGACGDVEAEGAPRGGRARRGGRAAVAPTGLPERRGARALEEQRGWVPPVRRVARAQAPVVARADLGIRDGRGGFVW